MKSILVHINPDEGQEARFQAALDVARQFSSHLICLQAEPLESYTSIDPYGVSQMMSETIERIREVASDEQERMEGRLQAEGVTWDWHIHTGDPARLLGDHSWLADMVIVSSPATDWKPRFDAPPAAADVIVRSRAPVLVVPAKGRGFDCTGTAAIAWDGSPEACSAIRAALPLLAKAEDIHLISVADEDDPAFPLVEGSAYLSRHGLASTLHQEKAGKAPVSETLLEAARDNGASWLVMGGYGHSRLRESILGGITRGVLQRTQMPVVLAH